VEAEKAVPGERLNSTFKSGGTQIDAIRNISGGVYTLFGNVNGCFHRSMEIDSKEPSKTNSANWVEGAFGFLASNVVPTAVDNRVRTLSDRWWRRVA
jgi:hypothetical protein